MKEDKIIINSQTSEETSTKTPVVEDVKEQGDPKFFRTVYKRKDIINEAVVLNDCERRSQWKAPMLVEYTFYRDGKKIETEALYLGADNSASLRISLKFALEVLEKSNKLYATFEFSGLTFEIRREDKYKDLLLIISEAIEFQNTVQRKIESLRNTDTANV